MSVYEQAHDKALRIIGRQGAVGLRGPQFWVGFEKPGFKHHIYGSSFDDAFNKHAAFCRRYPAFIRENYGESVPKEAGRQKAVQG